MVVRHFIPPSHSAREAVLALAAANKYRWRVLGSGSRPEPVGEAQSREAFPMGYRGHTHIEDGWVDLACGPKISLDIKYVSRNHHSDYALPNTMHVDINAPTVLLRVFGFLATDLLGLKVGPSQSPVFTTTGVYNCRKTTLECFSSSQRIIPCSPLSHLPPCLPNPH